MRSGSLMVHGVARIRVSEPEVKCGGSPTYNVRKIIIDFTDGGSLTLDCFADYADQLTDAPIDRSPVLADPIADEVF